MRVELRWDAKAVEEYVAAWQEPAVRRTLGAAASAYGRAAKPVLKAETPVGRPGNKYATAAGNLRAVTRYRRFRARTGAIGVVIAAMGKSAYYRRFVAGGTKPHLILPRSTSGKLRIVAGFASAVHHPGAKPNPYADRAASRAEAVGLAAAERVIERGLDAQRVFETTDN